MAHYVSLSCRRSPRIKQARAMLARSSLLNMHIRTPSCVRTQSLITFLLLLLATMTTAHTSTGNQRRKITERQEETGHPHPAAPIGSPKIALLFLVTTNVKHAGDNAANANTESCVLTCVCDTHNTSVARTTSSMRLKRHSSKLDMTAYNVTTCLPSAHVQRFGDSGFISQQVCIYPEISPCLHRS